MYPRIIFEIDRLIDQMMIDKIPVTAVCVSRTAPPELVSIDTVFQRLLHTAAYVN